MALLYGFFEILRVIDTNIYSVIMNLVLTDKEIHMQSETVTNTSCTSFSASATGNERRLPIRIDLEILDICTEVDIISHFDALNLTCNSCKNKYCCEAIFEITGFANHLTQIELDEYASKICEIFERHYMRIKVFTFSENNCGFFKVEQTARKTQAVSVA